MKTARIPGLLLAALLLLFATCTEATPEPTHAAAAPADPAGVPGTLLLCGGGTLPQVIFDEFLERAGGDAARVVVIPTASKSPERLDPDTIRGLWKERGAPQVAVLHTRSRDEADREAFVAPLKQATGVWFPGGGQSRIARAYVGTAVERELAALLHRGGVIGGTSAGAAVQTRLMISGGNPKPRLGRGFDLLPGSVVDQHFLERHRKRRLRRVLADHPGFVGFGIDEGTALVASGQRLQVLGRSTVTVLLGAGGGEHGNEIELRAGDEADLAELRRAAKERMAHRVSAVGALESR